MKLAPHVVLDTMRKLGAKHEIFRSPDALRGVIALLHQAVLFDFGTIHPAAEHKAFALDLYERDLFALPYPVTAFAFEGTPHTNAVHSVVGKPAGGMMLLHCDAALRISAIMFTESRDQDHRSLGALPIGAVMHAVLGNPSSDSVDVTEETYPLLSDELMAMMYGDAGPTGHDLMRQRLCSNLIGCMGMTVMLMSKGVETEHEPAPTRLNKARKIQGKPPIGERYTVRISMGDTYSVATTDGEESIAGHTRGSPRLHWRRGHFRTLYRGTETERVVPVAPALIGANDRAEDVRQKAYKVAP